MKNRNYSLTLDCPNCDETLEIKIIRPKPGERFKISCEICGFEFLMGIMTRENIGKLISDLNTIIINSLKTKKASGIIKALSEFDFGISVDASIKLFKLSEGPPKKSIGSETNRNSGRLFLTKDDRNLLKALKISVDKNKNSKS